MKIRPLTEEERSYTYSQSTQIMAQTGCIGHLRGDFDTNGKGFFTTWDDHQKQYKTEQFKTELDEVINSLRFSEDGFLKDRSSMSAFMSDHPEAIYQGNYCMEAGFRVDTKDDSYLFRCNPTPGDYNFYCYCYVSELLNRHLEEAKKGIRFIDSHYNELFHIPDGGKIQLIYPDGEKQERTCHYIDEYHTQIGSNLFHICEFAERMQQNGVVYEPVSQEIKKTVEKSR